MAKKKALTPWEKAKTILRKDYVDNVITDSMKPKDVWAMRDEFKEVKYENFRSNFARLKKSIKANQDRADSDEAGFRHDMTIYTLAKDTPEYWDGSEAQRLLKTDLKLKQHEQMRPKMLWSTRPEYQQFTLKKFRDHIYQELRGERETNYWIVERKKKKDGADFYDPVLAGFL